MSHIVDILTMWRANRQTVELPSAEELRALLKSPFADSEKVNITKWTYESLLSTFSPDQCSRCDLATLFMTGKPDPNLMTVVSAVGSPPP